MTDSAPPTEGVTTPPDKAEVARMTDHDFRPVAGHPDDDECTHREDGTDATYCGYSYQQHLRDFYGLHPCDVCGIELDDDDPHTTCDECASPSSPPVEPCCDEGMTCLECDPDATFECYADPPTSTAATERPEHGDA